ncbi:hypothetical protein D3C87_1626910 [compost metagenome]
MAHNSLDVTLMPRVFVHLVPRNCEALAHPSVGRVLRERHVDFEIRGKDFYRGLGRLQQLLESACGSEEAEDVARSVLGESL